MVIYKNNFGKRLTFLLLMIITLSIGGARSAGRGPKGVSASTPLSDVVGALNTQVMADTILLRQTSNAVVYLSNRGSGDLMLTGTIRPYGGVISKNGVYSFDGVSGKTVIGGSQTAQKLLGGNPVCAQVAHVNTGAGAYPYSGAWSPDGKYFAVLNQLITTLDVYLFSEDSLTLVGSVGAGGSQYPTSVSWSPDGQYLAVVNYDDCALLIYAFSGGTPALVGSVSTGLNSLPYLVSWSSDGLYLAVVNEGGNSFGIYSFSGGSPTQVGADVATGINLPHSVSWSPQGQYLAIVNSGSSLLQIYSFSGDTPTQVGSVLIGNDTSPWSAFWSPDGTYLAVANGEGNTLQVYSFSGGDPTLVGSVSTGDNSGPVAASWSPDGQYIVVANYTSSTLQVYSFLGGSLKQVGVDITTGVDRPYPVFWSPDGRYIALVNLENALLQIFSVSSALFAPELTISGNMLGLGDLTITGSAQLGQTTINGTLNVASSMAKIGVNGLAGTPGGVGILTLGGNGDSGGNGELFLGGFGGYGGYSISDRTVTGTGCYGNGVLSIGAQYVVATKRSRTPSDTTPLTYQLELSPTWTTCPLVMINTSVFSGSDALDVTYSYTENFIVALAPPATANPLFARGDTSHCVYQNDSSGASPVISLLSSAIGNPDCILSGNSLTITLQVPDGFVGAAITAPYVTNIQVAGLVVRAS